MISKYFQKIFIVRGWNQIQWGFAGGKMDENGSFTECLVREIKKELNKSIEDKVVEDLSFPSRYRRRIIKHCIIEVTTLGKYQK